MAAIIYHDEEYREQQRRKHICEKCGRPKYTVHSDGTKSCGWCDREAKRRG